MNDQGLKNAAWAGAWIFGILCGAKNGVSGFLGGMIVGSVIGALVYVAIAFLVGAMRLILLAALLSVALYLLSQ